MEIFDAIADERRLTADFVASLDPDQLATPSLCDAWTVRDVAAHLLMPLVTPMPKVVLAMARHGMNFDRASISLTAATARRSTADIVTGLRDRADSRFTPPGLGPEAPLTDLLVHGQDMRRPLGMTREIPAERQQVALDFLCGKVDGRGLVPRSRTEGLHLVATDLDWEAGPATGPEISGPAEALMMAVAGRTVALADLTGPGLADLQERLAG